jgi:starch phosphorylase
MSVTVNALAQNTLLESVEYHLLYTIAKPREEASRDDILHALAHSIRSRLIEGLLKTEERLYQRGAKRLVYLSAEYLIGQSLRNNLFNLRLLHEAEVASQAFGFDLSEIIGAETDAPLGNGGLGRLAACFMDQLSVWSVQAGNK